MQISVFSTIKYSTYIIGLLDRYGGGAQTDTHTQKKRQADRDRYREDKQVSCDLHSKQ